MGPLVKYSNRLILRVENQSKAKEVLDLYLRNRIAFERYEPTRPANFYSLDYHSNALQREYISYSLGTFLRYYVYMASNPNKIIGAVNFNFFQGQHGSYAEIGYKIDSLYQERGIGYEACMTALQVLVNDYDIHQVDARIHPNNIASLRLANKMGFRPVRLEPQSANIMGRYEDLMRYSLRI